LELASEVADGFGRFEQCPGGVRSEGYDNFRLNNFKLVLQVAQAVGNFIRFGVAVFGRPTLENIADVYIFPLQAHCVDNAVEQFACPSYERAALCVFIRPGAFADKNYSCIGIAFTRHGVGAGFTEAALAAFANLIRYPVKLGLFSRKCL
jgi:hypothetical protein